jgi:serine/threonine protein kinase
MPADERLEELLDHWEELRASGRQITPEELCRDCPDLASEVRRRVRSLQAMDWLNEGPIFRPGSASAASPSGQQTDTGMFQPGQEPVLGYRLVRRLGRGGFGQVWKAVGPGEVEVALKIVPLGQRAGDVEMRALQAVKNIRHPNLLAISGVWQLNDLLIFAMELADRTVSDRHGEAVNQGNPGIPGPELLQYMLDAARGIDFLNGPHPDPEGRNTAGIQHRDIKPQNLLLVGGGVKVGDYGLARVLEHTVTGHSDGLTVAYAAPEFFDGKTSTRSDQYSLAVTYCHLRGGRLPFAGNPTQIMDGHLHRPPDLTMLPEVEWPAVSRALAKDPKQRWPSCMAFVAALRLHVGQSDSKISRSDQPAGTLRPAAESQTQGAAGLPATAKRFRSSPIRPWLLLGALLVVLAAAVWLGYWSVGLTGDRSGEMPANPPAARHTSGSAEMQEYRKSFVNSIGMRLMLIPAGKFTMGSLASEEGHQDEELMHEVEITNSFYMGAYEVTQAEYERVMGTNPSAYAATGNGRDKLPAGQDTSRFPVEQVSWEDATIFCRNLVQGQTRSCLIAAGRE